MSVLADIGRHTPGEGVGGVPYEGQASSSAVTHASDVQLADLAYVTGWRGEDTVIATAVALAESDGKTYSTNRNTNGTTDYGLWQVNSSHFGEAGWGSAWTPPQLFVPTNNGAAAYHVWKQQGWKAWSTYNSGAYQQYMDRARAAYKVSASGSQGNANDPTSWNILGINTPNWLGGFNGPSVGNAAAGAANAISSIPDFLNLLVQPGTWLLVLKVIGGILLVGFGLKWMIEQK